MIVIAERLLLLGFVFKLVFWLAGDSRLQQTFSLRIHLVERQCLSPICPSTIITYFRSLEASLSTSANRSIAGPTVLLLNRNRPVTGADNDGEEATTGERKSKAPFPLAPRKLIRLMAGRDKCDFVRAFRDSPLTGLNTGSFLDLAPSVKRDISRHLVQECTLTNGKGKGNITILLWSRYATGNDSYLSCKGVLCLSIIGYKCIISSDSTKLGCP